MKTITYNEQTHRLVPVDVDLMNTAVRRILQHHGLIETANGAVEADIMDYFFSVISAAPQPEPVEVEPVEIIWPEYHYEAMGCGLEDRGITDRYEAMQHGWECALERVAGCLPEAIYTAPPDYEEIKRQLKVMREQLEEYRKDAERYRWLRDTQDGKTIRNMFRQEWDGAIDAALASVKGGA